MNNFIRNVNIILIITLGFCVEKIGTIYEVNGFVQVVSTEKDIPPTQAIIGRSIFNNDIIRSASDGFCKMIYDDRSTMIVIDPVTEVKLSDRNISRSLHLNFGSLYIKNTSGNKKNSFLFTKASQIKLLNGQIWMFTTPDVGDEIYIIDRKMEVFNQRAKQKVMAKPNTVVYSYIDGFFELIESDLLSLPDYVYNSQMLSLQQQTNFTQFNMDEINFRAHDLIPLFGIGSWRDPSMRKDDGFGIEISTGNYQIYEDRFNKIGLFPYYHKRNFKLKFNLDGYLPIGNSQMQLNKIETVYDILNHINYIQYSNDNNNFIFQVGSIGDISFGHGNLLKEYSNMLDYPRNRKTGVYMFFRTDHRNFSVDMFTSNIGDFQEGGGLFGVHGTMFLSERFPLTVGLGIIKDLDQFSVVNDFGQDWKNSNVEFSRSVTAMQFDLTYDLYHDSFYDAYLFSEMVGIWFPETHYYIRDFGTFEEPIEESNLCSGIPCNYYRDGTWGFTGPGIWLQYRHLLEAKVAFNINSALHIPQYFSTTYDHDRIRYTEYQFEYSQEWFDILEDINNVFVDYCLNISCDSVDSTFQLILPKDIYSMTDESQIKYPSMGVSTEFVYHYRDMVDVGFNFSYFKEFYQTTLNQDFFNYHFSVKLKDNVLKGVTEARAYYTQFFTNKPFDSQYHENMLRGIRVRVKLWRNISLVADVHDVFFDTDLDGNVDMVRTGGAEIMVKLK